jgi:hypothetical protein
MTPVYRALCGAALLRDGVLEPSLSATGAFRDGSSNLLEAPDGVGLALQALAFADAATGVTVGREVVKALAKQTGIEGLEARYEAECSSGHGNSNDLIDALHDAARLLAAQQRR